MGELQGQGCLDRTVELVIFFDENHCRNPHLIATIEESGTRCERHLDHFAPGTADTSWLPEVGRKGWCLLTTDARIRTNYLEREAVRVNGVRMFYFSRNQLAGREMALAIERALPSIASLYLTQPAPFTASISRSGEVRLRDAFYDIVK